MLCALYGNVAINCLLAQLVNFHSDISYKLYLVNLLSNIKNNNHEFYRLNRQMRDKFISKSNLFSKLFFNFVYYQMIGSCGFVALVTSTLAYMDPHMDFNLATIIIWLIVFTIWLRILFSLAMSSVIIAYVSLTFIKLQFRQICEDFKSYQTSRVQLSYEIIMNNIRRHQFWAQELDRIDDYLSKILGELSRAISII